MECFHFKVSLEAEDVFHVVQAGCLTAGPGGGAQRAVGERVAAGSFVCQLKSLAVSGVHHGVIADYVAASQRVDSNLGIGPLADDSVTAVAQFFSSDTFRTSAKISASVAAVPLGASRLRR